MNTQEAIISLATPVFFLLIAIEWLIARHRGEVAYRGNDTVASLGLGVMSQIVGVFTKLFTIGIYAWVYNHAALLHLPNDNLLVWAGALLAYDFLYYWLHRAGHEVNILWAAHVVHHQSEQYNLSTALRQTGSGFLLGWLFYLPLAIVGVPVEVFVVVALIDLLYQFWIHTGQIRKLGWFDRVFASPSNHRAHHAVNDRYLDRNYGGILILWDRLFGSFVEEDDRDPPVYGTRSPLRSFNPLWANAEVYWATAQDAWHARRWRDKLQVWLRPPGWRPADVAARFPKAAFEIRRELYNPPIPPHLAWYALAQFAVLLGLAVHFLQLAPVAPLGTLTGYAVYLMVSLCVLGALFDGHRTAPWLEGARLAGTVVFVLARRCWFGVAALPAPWVAMACLLAAVSAAWLCLPRHRPNLS
ncbi:sterol desaturase family protein [Pinirhizobacter sp.]|jgi:sterol desaturase/sphingolipid hydroxylase (fatty acid hydroxylase superfamily)|uniref:sterol desaturase family protein n=1 Tax=Pinirhizobacter sp. TaxID=2950432 RepID=UPI002F40A567